MNLCLSLPNYNLQFITAQLGSDTPYFRHCGEDIWLPLCLAGIAPSCKECYGVVA